MNIKLIRQLDVADCGAACLQMIAGYYGKQINLISIKEKIYVSKCGVSLLNVARGAEAIGFRTTKVKLSLSFLNKSKPLPCIIHINDEHFVVLYKIKINRFNHKAYYYIADPAYGKIKMSKEEFTSSWLVDKMGVALLLTPNQEELLKNDTTVDRTHQSSFKTLLNYFISFKKYIFQIAIGLLGASLISFVLPFLTQVIVDEGIANKNVGFIFLILLAQIVLLFGQLIINFIRNWLLLHINVRISINIISDFLSKLMRIPIKFFDAKSQGDIIQRISDHSVIERFLTDGLLNSIFSIFNILIFSVILGIYGIDYLSIFWIGSALSLFWIWIFNKKRKKVNYIRFQRSRESQDSMFEILNGMSEIKLNNNDLQRRWEWEKTQARLFKLNLLNLKLEQIQNISNTTLNQLKNTIIIFLAANAVINGNMSIGMMMSISYIIGALNSPVEQLSAFIQSMQDAKLSMERLTELQYVDDEYSTSNNSARLIDNKINIEFKNMTFSYDGNLLKPILNSLNMIIEEGKTVAFVGASGCGKTTLIKLLLGYYPPLSGEILINGKSIKEISLREWREKIGCVMQDGYIFSDSLLNNIIMKNQVDYERLNYALQISNCEEFVSNLPFGINTKIGPSGMNLSAGQKQRILIARAVYKNPDIIIFDEATSALDAKNESDISSKLQSFFSKRTAIIIAHRLSTVKNADIIYVLDKGRIVEAGKHNELIALKGHYFNLVQNQLV